MDDLAEEASPHFIYSTLRERIVEHVFISLKLMDKPSGCVIREYQITKHSKANARGTKLEKPGHRIVPRSKFDRLATLDSVLDRLFGTLS